MLGISNHYRKFIDNYAETAKPLYDLMELKNVPKHFRKRNGAVNGKRVLLTWNDSAQTNFEKLKQTLCSDLVLALPDFNKPFYLSTDASDYGYGAVLEQKQDDGSFRPIAYFSKNYTAAQKNYATPEKELLALVMAIEYFHQYLYGKPFFINTDHLPLTWIQTKKNTHARLERWLLRLSIYDFEIIHIPGKLNVVADNFSRLPDENEVNTDPNDDYFDTLVADIELSDEENNCTSFQEINVIAEQTNSNESISLIEEQIRDPDIAWIIKVILDNPNNKPEIKQFKNTTQ